MKQLIQKAIAPFGYTFRKLSSLAPFTPFVREIAFDEAAFKFWITNEDANAWYSVEHWKALAEYDALIKMAQPGARILEIGSHHGFTGLMLSRRVGDSGLVVGVEANPMNALVDQAQTTLNGFKNIKFIHAAASSKPGTLRIAAHHNASVTNNGEGSEVKAVTGDMLDAEYGPFDMLKVDVEGYEVDVLKGCRNILSRFPKLALEIHYDELAKYGHSLDDILELINAARYKGEMVIRPERPSERVPFNIDEFRSLKRGTQPYLVVNLFLEKK